MRRALVDGMLESWPNRKPYRSSLTPPFWAGGRLGWLPSGPSNVRLRGGRRRRSYARGAQDNGPDCPQPISTSLYFRQSIIETRWVGPFYGVGKLRDAGQISARFARPRVLVEQPGSSFLFLARKNKHGKDKNCRVCC